MGFFLDGQGWGFERPNVTGCYEDQLPLVQFGFIEPSDEEMSDFHSERIIYCDPGFRVIGRKTVKCQTHGEWSHPGRCVPGLKKRDL